METFEIRYFLKVSELQSIRKAADALHISPSAISKAISRIENQIQTKLIEKVGRNIQLTSHGKKFSVQSAEFLAFHQNIINSYEIDTANFKLKIVGPELPISTWGPKIMSKIIAKFPDIEITLSVTSNEQAREMVEDYKADYAIFSSQKKISGDLSKKIDDVVFKVFASKKHQRLKNKKSIHVNDVIKERFISTSSDTLQFYKTKSEGDGWRDDKFKRTNLVFTNSLKALDQIVQDGLAVSYLPENYGVKLGLRQIEIMECPYTCKFSVYAIRNKHSLDKIWSLI